MIDTLTLPLAGFAGVLLGMLFFGGLWWTIRAGVVSKQPALWFLGSMIGRTSLILAGFYFVGGGHWQRLLICLLGFILGRGVVIWLTRPALERHSASAKETRHATES